MKILKVLGLLSLSGVVLAACGDEEGTTTAPATDETVTESSSAVENDGVLDNDDADLEGLLSLDDVVAIYTEEYADAQIQKVDFDKDFGEWTYELTGVSNNREYEVEIDATTGDIVNVDEDDVDDDEFLNFDNIIEPTEAIQIAKTALAQEVELEGWELDIDDDGGSAAKYDIDFNGDDRDVTVNAETGEVLEID